MAEEPKPRAPRRFSPGDFAASPPAEPAAAPAPAAPPPVPVEQQQQRAPRTFSGSDFVGGQQEKKESGARRPPLAGFPGAPVEPIGAELKYKTPEEQARAKRLLLEIGVPTVAGLFMGPEMAVPTRLAIMAALGGGASAGGLLVEPPKDATEGATRVGVGALSGAGGEALGLGLAAGARAAAPPLRRFAENQGMRALGLMYSNLRRLGSDFMNSGRRTARAALDEGVLSPLANSETMAGRAQAVADRTGASVRATRDAIDASGAPGVDAGRIMGEIDQLLNNWRPGISDEAVLNRHLGDTLQDVLAHSDSQATLSMADIAALKQLLARRANFHAAPNPSSRGADLAGQSELARGVAQGFEEAQAASNLTLEEFEQFIRDKQLHGAMQELIDPAYGALTARVARDAGNSQAGLLPTVAAAGRDPVSALGTLLAARTLSQRGNQVAAVGADRLAEKLLTPELQAALIALMQSGAQAATQGSRSPEGGLGIATAR
jgi:hypothetical protein